LNPLQAAPVKVQLRFTREVFLCMSYWGYSSHPDISKLAGDSSKRLVAKNIYSLVLKALPRI